MHRPTTHPIRAALAAVCLALLAACSQEPPPAPDEIVAERAKARWEAMVARDFEAAWQYYSPGFREQMAAADFAVEMSRRPVRWTASEILEVTCADDEPKCTVRARVNYDAPSGLPGVGRLSSRSGVTETWLQIGDQWWYSQDA
jgi:hypothetical protein